MSDDAQEPAPARDTILICYDGSDGAKRAIEVAHGIAGDCRATVLHLWEPPGRWMFTDAFGGMPTWSPAQITEVDDVMRERGGKVLDEGVQLARDAGFDAEGHLEPSATSEWRTILDVGDELDVRLIILGGRGLSAVESAILGSVSNAIVHHSRRPVLIVPPVS